MTEPKTRNSHRRRLKRIWTIAALSPVLGASFLLPPSAWASNASAFVRVNQIGYEIGHTGRAYLMVNGAAGGNKFSLNDSQGAAAFSGAVGAAAGHWGSYSIYLLDFTIEKVGTYSIVVTGSFTAKSPEFQLNTPENLYAGALSNALLFYQNQRDGKDFIASDLRKEAGHLNDKNAKVYQTPEFGGREGSQIKGDLVAMGSTIDASGGWWDAGDYLKFVHTTSYVVAMMLMGRRDFPNQMGPGSSKADFTKEAKFGLDWLLRMWDEDSKTLYYQVGIGSQVFDAENDHSIWRLPQEDDASHGTEAKYRYIRNRPVFTAGPAGSKISPNLAGRLAGDFALCYQIYHASDSGYGNKCLLAAQHIFDLADTAPAGRLLTAAPYDFYGEQEWSDDLEFAATELYFAVRSGNLPEGLPHPDAKFYFKAATEWAAQYIHGKGKESGALEVADISGLAHFDLCRAMAGRGSEPKLAVTQADLLSDLRKTLDRAVSRADKDPFGFGIPWGDGDTPANGLAIAVIAKEYDYLSKNSTFADSAERWTANALGANAWGASFIVGAGTTFPHCIHHQVANLMGSSPDHKPILTGAVVEGPLRKAVSGAPRGVVPCPRNGGDLFGAFNGNDATYKDDVRFYSTSEPAIDLAASSFLMFAWQVAGAPSSTP